ncbi:MAG TPA: 3'(2'),5'-bisphosphate nucleotidase CysQ [Patescibacteria group bacterium]|nr:3'(2'),5'-bisphosphate nucleotidase CysQ [Patescibacteria group bacterium]
MESKILEHVIETSKKAGWAALDYYNSEVEVDKKDDDSPITKADRESNRIILEELSRYDYGILSEEKEDDKKRLEQDRVWVIDPLDGTKDFINQTDEFSVMIGLVEHTGKLFRPILGVVYVPAQDTVYYALKDGGAFKKVSDDDPEPIRVSEVDTASECRMVGSRFHSSELEDKIEKALEIQTRIPCGSVGVKISKIASGEAELNFNPSDKTWEWDVCAPDIIMMEAGGTLTDLDGKFFNYNRKDPRNHRGYIASNGSCHNHVIEEVQNYEKD